MPDNSIRSSWTDGESRSSRACQRVIREARVLAGGEHVSGGRELLARAREVLCFLQDGETLRVSRPSNDPTVTLNYPAPKTPQGLPVYVRKVQVITHGLRGLKQKIIIHLTMFGTAILPDRACTVSGPFPAPNRMKTAITITTWYTANYSV